MEESPWQVLELTDFDLNAFASGLERTQYDDSTHQYIREDAQVLLRKLNRFIASTEDQTPSYIVVAMIPRLEEQKGPLL